MLKSCQIGAACANAAAEAKVHAVTICVSFI
jgi:hypothetical protein